MLTQHYAIELWRGLAAWMVLTAHYAQGLLEGHTIWGFFVVGVNFFFVISGFVFGKVIYSGQLALLPYATRRFFRIYPLYLCSLLLYYAATPTHPDKNAILWQHLLFIHTTHSAEIAFFFNPAYWSLPVEVTFYLAVPLLAMIQTRWQAGLLSLFLIFIGGKLFIAAFATPIADPNILTVLRFHLVGILPEFLVGIFAYHFISCYANHLTKWMGYGLAAIGLLGLYGLSQVYLLFDYVEFMDNVWLRAYFDLACGICFSFVLIAMVLFFKPRGLLQTICLWVGNMSYGVYLLHNLIPLTFKQFGIELTGLMAYGVYSLITVVLALLLYVLLENPLRQFGRYAGQKLTRHAA